MSESTTLRIGGLDKFRITITKKMESLIRGDVEQVVAWEVGDGGIGCGWEHYLHFQMGWDGCCHLYFGEEDGGSHNGYLHMCGADAFEDHISLIRELWKIASTEIEAAIDSEYRELRIESEAVK